MLAARLHGSIRYMHSMTAQLVDGVRDALLLTKVMVGLSTMYRYSIHTICQLQYCFVIHCLVCKHHEHDELMLVLEELELFEDT
jgi:hypothetical protein